MHLTFRPAMLKQLRMLPSLFSSWKAGINVDTNKTLFTNDISFIDSPRDCRVTSLPIYYMHIYVSYHTLETKHTLPLPSWFRDALEKSFTVPTSSLITIWYNTCAGNQLLQYLYRWLVSILFLINLHSVKTDLWSQDNLHFITAAAKQPFLSI